MSATPAAGRRYRGLTPEDRRAERRARLLDAGLQLFGTQGYAATTIEEVCARSSVTARHFYEEFGGRDGLLLAVYERIIEEHMAVVGGALDVEAADAEAFVRGGVGAAIGAWSADERRARVAFIEVVGVSPRVEERRHEVIQGYATMLAGSIEALAQRGLVPDRDYGLGALAVVGATTQLMTSWLQEPRRPPTQPIVDEVVRILTGALSVA